MFIINSNLDYISCSTKFDNEYNLISITHYIKSENANLFITLLV